MENAERNISSHFSPPTVALGKPEKLVDEVPLIKQQAYLTDKESIGRNEVI
jgi:hypothetical protein